MDPASISGVIIAVVQVTVICLKLGKDRLGPSRHTATSLDALVRELYCFNGAMQQLKTYLQITEDEHVGLGTLAYLEVPLRSCNKVLRLLEGQLARTNFMNRVIAGRRFDKKLQRSLETLRGGWELFEMVLLADQRATPNISERYVDKLARDIGNVQTTLNKGSASMGYMSAQLNRHAERAETRHME